jgi:hypothetical protein
LWLYVTLFCNFIGWRTKSFGRLKHRRGWNINPLNAELTPIYHFLALLGAHHILQVSRIRV